MVLHWKILLDSECHNESYKKLRGSSSHNENFIKRKERTSLVLKGKQRNDEAKMDKAVYNISYGAAT